MIGECFAALPHIADESPESPPSDPPLPGCLSPAEPFDKEPAGCCLTPIILPLVIGDPELLRMASLARRRAIRRSSATSGDQ